MAESCAIDEPAPQVDDDEADDDDMASSLTGGGAGAAGAPYAPPPPYESLWSRLTWPKWRRLARESGETWRSVRGEDATRVSQLGTSRGVLAREALSRG